MPSSMHDLIFPDVFPRNRRVDGDCHQLMMSTAFLDNMYVGIYGDWYNNQSTMTLKRSLYVGYGVL